MVRAGYLTPDGRYLRLLQSDAAEPAVLAVETGRQPGGRARAGRRGRAALGRSTRGAATSRSGPPTCRAAPGRSVRMLITGSGTEDEVRALAGAALAGELLPARAP